MKRTRRSHKTHTFSIRVPEKIRFGLDLLATKNNAQMSALVLRAIEDMFEREGLTSRESGQLLSLLDRIYDERPGVRTRNLWRYAPELLTPQEKMAIQAIVEDEERLGREFTAEELEPKFAAAISFVEKDIFGG